LRDGSLCRRRVRTRGEIVDPLTGRSYESDILLLLDSYAVMADCKAGRLPPKARQAKGRALREQIQELVVEPAAQARRLADALIAADGPLEVLDVVGQPITLDAGPVRRTLTLGVTLEPFASFLPRLSDPVAAGLTDREVDELALSVALTDLEIIAEILPARRRPCITSPVALRWSTARSCGAGSSTCSASI
jgi:hypothetical protein